MSELSKTFGATRALEDVSIDIRAGEIHALMGQNGSGKSTLIKVLAGYHQPDGGATAELDGVPFDIGHEVPDGLRFVHQDLGLVLELSAQDNLALHGGFAKGFGGRVLWREQESETRRAARALRRRHRHPPAAGRGDAGGADGRRDRRRAAGLARRRRVLVLDEPTAVLPHDEVERLFAVVAGGAQGGDGDALRLAPDGRDLRARRPGDDPARRPAAWARTTSPRWTRARSRA